MLYSRNQKVQGAWQGGEEERKGKQNEKGEFGRRLKIYILRTWPFEVLFFVFFLKIEMKSA